MSSHMNDQHVLSFERFLLPNAITPMTDKLLTLIVDVIIVDMLEEGTNKF